MNGALTQTGMVFKDTNCTRHSISMRSLKQPYQSDFISLSPFGKFTFSSLFSQIWTTLWLVHILLPAGNMVSFMVYLAPVTKFTIGKISEGFQALPYSVGLLCVSLLLYYALLRSGKFLIVSINITGCIILVTYLILFMIYSPRAGKETALSLSLAYSFCLIFLLAGLQKPCYWNALGQEIMWKGLKLIYRTRWNLVSSFKKLCYWNALLQLQIDI